MPSTTLSKRLNIMNNVGVGIRDTNLQFLCVCSEYVLHMCECTMLHGHIYRTYMHVHTNKSDTEIHMQTFIDI